MLYSLILLVSDKNSALAIWKIPVRMPLFNDLLPLNVRPFKFLNKFIVEDKSVSLKVYKALLTGASYSSIRIYTFLL